jgi:hypothetical protein
MTLIIHPESAIEVDDAFSFYATRSRIIAADFLNQFEHATVKLLNNPQLYLCRAKPRHSQTCYAAIPLQLDLSHYRNG